MASVLRHGAVDGVPTSHSTSDATRGISYDVRQGTMAVAASSTLRRRTKKETCDRYLLHLRSRSDIDIDKPEFIDSVQKHFEALPTRYALDVNLSGTEVLQHKQLLEQARQYPDAVAFVVRDIEQIYPKLVESVPMETTNHSHHQEGDIVVERSQPVMTGTRQRRGLRPSFPSSSSLQSLSDFPEHGARNEDVVGDVEKIVMKEIIIAAKDRPQLLSRLSKAMSDASLDIREAHVFNTNDGYSFDVFVVDSTVAMETRQVEEFLRNAFHTMLMNALPMDDSAAIVTPSRVSVAQSLENQPDLHRQSSIDDFEVDINHVQILSKIATSTFGHVYKGQYYGQDVAVKIVKDVIENPQLHNEFKQEVSIMKRVRHRNVVQFIGACTVRPSLCILFEYMEGGSVHDYLRKGPLSLMEVLRIALHVARGMDYLHRRRIIHRDLKAANLLIDGTGTAKIADFGVAKIIDGTLCGTAETGTYRWMAPEVIEHKDYDHKVDVYSFSILLWELLTGEVPYSGQTPIQAAVSVVQNDMRPPIPPHCPVHLAHLMHACWARDPTSRPEFVDIVRALQDMLEAERQNVDTRRLSLTATSSRGLLSKLRRPGSGSR